MSHPHRVAFKALGRKTFSLMMLAAGLFLLPTAPGAFAQSRTGEQLVSCSSSHYRHATCDVGAVILDAELVRQVSGARCAQGSSWGIDGTAIWVDKGCRGDFRVLTGPFMPLPFRDITCSSGGMRYTQCDAGMVITRVVVVRQHSASRCQEGRSFGAQGSTLWVDKGCRATFRVYGIGLDVPPGDEDGDLGGRE